MGNNQSAGWSWRSVAMAALAVLIYWAGSPLTDLLVYDRAAVQAGEVWRIFTGHFVHCDTGHLLWNVGGLLVLGVLFERRLGRRYFPLIFVGAMAIGGWLLWNGDWAAYCGLSGLLNTLLAAGLIAEWRATGSWLLILVGGGAIGKIFVEILNREALFTSILWPPVPEAHMVGFSAGLVLFVMGGDQTRAKRSPGRNVL